MEGGPPRLSLPGKRGQLPAESAHGCGGCRAGTGPQKLLGLLSRAGATARDARAAGGDYLTRHPC